MKEGSMDDKKVLPDRLRALFEIAGRETTAELFKIAGPIAAGSTATAVITEAPAFIRAALPNLADDELDRVALLITWAMYITHTTTTRELSRKWKIAKTLGHADDDALDFALAEGAELAEQRFAAWAASMPVGAASNMTNKFMSAFAERVAARVLARATVRQREEESDFSDCV
jgi:hypothetical protein